MQRVVPRQERDRILLFALNAVMLLVAFLLPWPWLADAYVWAFDGLANGILSLLNAVSAVKLHFDAPSEIAVRGSWKGDLQLFATHTGQNARTHLDIRGLSYRPLVTYLALAIAAPLGARPWHRFGMLSLGALFVVCLGFVFTALPILSHLSMGGAFGKPTTLVLATAYDAMATPVMVYAIPAIVFWLGIGGRLE